MGGSRWHTATYSHIEKEVSKLRTNQQPTLMEVSPEAAMVNHGFFPKDPWKDAWQFILPTLASKLLGRKTPWDQVDEVRTLLELYLKTVDTPEQ